MKYLRYRDVDIGKRSPPSRGAWIEIVGWYAVDRNRRSRPPRGGRGLKYLGMVYIERGYGRPPRGGRGLK